MERALGSSINGSIEYCCLGAELGFKHHERKTNQTTHIDAAIAFNEFDCIIDSP